MAFRIFQYSGIGCRGVLPRLKPDRLRANQAGLVVSDRRPKSLVVAAAIRPWPIFMYLTRSVSNVPPNCHSAENRDTVRFLYRRIHAPDPR